MRPKTLVAILALSGALCAAPALTRNQLEVEPNHTSIGFSIPIAGGLTRVTGKFTEFEIWFTYEGDEVLESIAGSTLEAAIATASIDTGIDARDKHLRQADFFDVERFPEIRFFSERIERSEAGYVAVGELTMHGVTKPLELDFEITGTTPNLADGVPMVGATARTTVRRSDFDLATDFKHTHIEAFLGDEVEIEIFCWLRPPKEAPDSPDPQD